MVVAATLLFAGLTGHIKVDGEGYMRLMLDGKPVYAREADLTVVNGQLGSHGATFLPSISYSGSISRLKIDLMGHVSVDGKALGQLVIGLSSDAAQRDEAGFYEFTQRPSLMNPGEGTAGVIRFDEPQTADPKPVTPPARTSSETSAPTEPKVSAEPSLPVEVKKTVPAAKPAASNPSTTITKTKGSKLEVIVRLHSEVGPDPVKLSDVASLSGPSDLLDKAKDLVIANSPAVGVRRILDERTLTYLLRTVDIVPSKLVVVCPNGADVMRHSQLVDDKQILETAQKAVAAKYSAKVPLVCMQKFPPLRAPEGEVTLEASEPEMVGDGYFVVITVKVNDEVTTTRSLTLMPSKDAHRAKQGEPVTVMLSTGGTSVEVSGKVKTGGYVGQQIEVIVDGVGAHPTVHIGTLVSPGHVEVTL